MAGPNLTGKPKTEDYRLGRGEVYFAELTAGNLIKNWRDMGNAPEVNFTVETETQEHTSSRAGLKVTDKEVVISQKLTVTFSVDELSHENIKLFLSGDQNSPTNAAVAGFSQYAMIPNANIDGDGSAVKPRWYDIQTTAGLRAYDITEAGDVALETSNGTPVPLVLNTDYELDLVMGRILLLDTSVVRTAKGNSEDIMVTLTADAAPSAVNEVRGLKTTNVIGALKIIAINPANNDKKEEVQIHKLSLKPDGDLALISDEFTSMSFTAVAESNTDLFSDSNFITWRTIQD